jgi:hypothetical protein
MAQCTTAADCAAEQDCIASACVPIVACNNSLDCPAGRVCDGAAGHCVECVRSEDCRDGRVCAASICSVPCASDNECTPMGLLCRVAGGYCAACVVDSDCQPDQHCAVSGCRPSVCEPGTASCDGRTIVRCSQSGDRIEAREPCLVGTECVEEVGQASCVEHVCDPGTSRCNAGQLETCADDGLSIVGAVDCGDSGTVCRNDACRPIVCQASQAFCAGNTRRLCNPYGTASQSTTLCAVAAGRCDPTQGECVGGECAANMPSCDGAIATTCNASGSGYLAGGTDCAASGQTCAGGACVDRVCDPDAEICDGDAILQCNDSGSAYLVRFICAAGRHCAGGSCSDNICPPMQLHCEGSDIMRCNADGSDRTLAEGCPAGKTCDPATVTCL